MCDGWLIDKRRELFWEVNSDAGISLLSQRRLIYHSVQNVKPYTTADRKDSV